MTHQDRTDFRERAYACYDKVFARRDRFDNIDKPVSPLNKAWLPADKDAEILDFGFGIGETLAGLRAAGYRRLSGVDTSRPQYEQARRRLPNDIALYLQDGRTFLRDRHEAYDVIIVYDVLEHFTKQEGFSLCQMLHEALRPGGVLVVKVPNNASLLGAFGRDIDLTHMTGYTEYSLFHLFDATGFVDHHLVERDLRMQLHLWRPWRPFTGLSVRPRLNVALHRIVYWLAGTKSPRCFEFVMEAWTHKPNRPSPVERENDNAVVADVDVARLPEAVGSVETL